MASYDFEATEKLTAAIEGPFVLAPNEQFVICPYDQSHKILLDRLKYHLERCRRNYLKLMDEKKLPVYYEYCRYNDFHVYPKIEMPTHEKYCPEKMRFDVETDLVADDIEKDVVTDTADQVDWSTFDGWRLVEDGKPDVDDTASTRWSTENLACDEQTTTEINDAEELDQGGAEGIREEVNFESDVVEEVQQAPRGRFHPLRRLPLRATYGGLDCMYDEVEEKENMDGGEGEEVVEEIWDSSKGFAFFMKPEGLRSMPHRLSKTDKKAYHKICTENYPQRMEALNYSAKFHTQPKPIAPSKIVDPYLSGGGYELLTAATANLTLKGDDGFVETCEDGVAEVKCARLGMDEW